VDLRVPGMGIHTAIVNHETQVVRNTTECINAFPTITSIIVGS
jgi:hypothetical protein